MIDVYESEKKKQTGLSTVLARTGSPDLMYDVPEEYGGFTATVTAGKPASPRDAFRASPVEMAGFIERAEAEAAIPDASIEDAVSVLYRELAKIGITVNAILVNGTTTEGNPVAMLIE